MSQDVVIRAEGLGKAYRIGHEAERERYVALRDVLARNIRSFARSAADLARGRPIVAGDEVEEFWALRDLNFEVRRGEVVGIIGRNGAGKSTLLKVLSRITEPSEGRVTIKGRVASLLEVGTGFHPELSGRENVFLNGAILGMSRAEIRRKFDEIVEFAEIERFLDTPVKRYSSGMYVRLAFAVAAHLEPEILVVDEVLAVGDAEFQRKCLGKMKDVASHGRTVLFVSHQLGMVSRLCSRGLVLANGRVHLDEAIDPAIGAYLSLSGGSGDFAPRPRRTDDEGRLTGLSLRRASAEPADEFRLDEPVVVAVEFELSRAPASMLLGVAIEDRRGTRLTTWVARLSEYFAPNQVKAELRLTIDPGFIAPGAYQFTVALFQPGHIYDIAEGQLALSIVDSGSAMAEFENVDYGLVLIPAKWRSAPGAEDAGRPRQGRVW